MTQEGVLYNNGDWEHVLCSIAMKTTVEFLETEGWGLKVKIKHWFNVFNVDAAARPAAQLWERYQALIGGGAWAVKCGRASWWSTWVDWVGPSCSRPWMEKGHAPAHSALHSGASLQMMDEFSPKNKRRDLLWMLLFQDWCNWERRCLFLFFPFFFCSNGYHASNLAQPLNYEDFTSKTHLAKSFFQSWTTKSTFFNLRQKPGSKRENRIHSNLFLTGF